MTTNIRNKAEQVSAWIEKHRAPEPDAKSVRRFVNERWPELDADLREQIYLAALARTF